jgi:hypothetical protein
MNRLIRSTCLTLAAGLALTLGGLAPSAADTPSAAMDCSKADAMMMAPMPMPSGMESMKPSGNVDKDFTQMAMMHDQMMMKMVHMEMACGKDAKAKAAAAKMYDEMQLWESTLQDIIKSQSQV